MIEVNLFATLRTGREKVYTLNADNIRTVKDIVSYLGIAPDDVAIILINGFHSNIEDPVEDGAVVSLFPPVAGG